MITLRISWGKSGNQGTKEPNIFDYKTTSSAWQHLNPHHPVTVLPLMKMNSRAPPGCEWRHISLAMNNDHNDNNNKTGRKSGGYWIPETVDST